MAEPWYRTAFGDHYRRIYAHRDAGEAERCVALLREGDVLESPLLDLGCGDGRHLPPLGRHVETAVGLDLSPDLLAAARQRSPAALLVQGDMRRLPLRSGAWGAAVSLFTAFGYFADDAENERPVAEVARILRPGGHWCLDVPDAARIRGELGDGRPRTRERAVDGLKVTETRRWDEDTRTVRKQVRLSGGGESPGEPARLEYEERVRIYEIAELEAMGRRHGLVRTAAWGGYGGEPLGEGDRWLLVFRRTAGSDGVGS